jgi:hypothetical protein
VRQVERSRFEGVWSGGQVGCKFVNCRAKIRRTGNRQYVGTVLKHGVFFDSSDQFAAFLLEGLKRAERALNV